MLCWLLLHPMGVLNLLTCHLLASRLQCNFIVHSLSHLIPVFVLAYQILLTLPMSFWTFSSFILSLHVLLHIWMGPYGKIIMSPKPQTRNSLKILHQQSNLSSCMRTLIFFLKNLSESPLRQLPCKELLTLLRTQSSHLLFFQTL